MEEHDVRVRFERMTPFLDERGRRLFAANEAMSMGHGGVEMVCVATGLARRRINRGMAGLRCGRDEIEGAIRRPGAGRKPEEDRQPGLLAALERLIEGAVCGDPEAPLRWISRSQRHLAKALRGEGFEVSLELQRFADESGLAITVTHLPPGTSKWNRIEHRLFAYISQNWRGKPRVSHQVIVQLISATTTENGLTVTCDLDHNLYQKGIQVTDDEMAGINIRRDDFHGEWNDTISPKKSSLLTSKRNAQTLHESIRSFRVRS